MSKRLTLPRIREQHIVPIAVACWILTTVTVIAATAYLRVNQIGGRAMWSTDACPQSDLACGQFPGWMTLGVVILLVYMAATLFIARHAAPSVFE